MRRTTSPSHEERLAVYLEEVLAKPSDASGGGKQFTTISVYSAGGELLISEDLLYPAISSSLEDSAHYLGRSHLGSQNAPLCQGSGSR